jgi:hypothetical protein
MTVLHLGRPEFVEGIETGPARRVVAAVSGVSETRETSETESREARARRVDCSLSLSRRRRS